MPEAPPEPTPVVLVSGTGRSGSTLLGNLLGEVPGWFSGGEIRFLWERGLQDTRVCGCGRPATACPVWSDVLERFAAAGHGVDPASVVATLRSSQRLRHLPIAAASPAAYARRLGDLPRILGDLYAAIRASTGARVVVDTSKLPLYGAALAASPGIDLTVVHLVRSPQASAYSWLRSKPVDDGGARDVMEQRGAGKSAMLWSVWNWATGRLFGRGSYVRFRYEDLVADPRRALEDVLALRGEHDALAFLEGTTARLSVNHTIAGNPDRLSVGEVRLRPDDAWVDGLRDRDRRLVSLLTTPLAARYGYRADGRVKESA